MTFVENLSIVVLYVLSNTQKDKHSAKLAFSPPQQSRGNI